MEKYIAVVNPNMDDDEISKLIRQDVAGALFCVSHNNYPLAARLIQQVKDLARKHNRPVSIIQDISEMTDSLDLEFGIKSGVHWVLVSSPKQAEQARGMDKSVSVIWKGKSIPKDFKPDAQLIKNEVKHFDFVHPKHKVLSSALKIAEHANVDSVLVSDIKIAQALSTMKPKQKIIYMPKDKNDAGKAALFRGVYPIFEQRYGKPGERVLDLRDHRHGVINTIV